MFILDRIINPIIEELVEDDEDRVKIAYTFKEKQLVN